MKKKKKTFICTDARPNLTCTGRRGKNVYVNLYRRVDDNREIIVKKLETVHIYTHHATAERLIKLIFYALDKRVCYYTNSSTPPPTGSYLLIISNS